MAKKRKKQKTKYEQINLYKIQQKQQIKVSNNSTSKDKTATKVKPSNLSITVKLSNKRKKQLQRKAKKSKYKTPPKNENLLKEYKENFRTQLSPPTASDVAWERFKENLKDIAGFNENILEFKYEFDRIVDKYGEDIVKECFENITDLDEFNFLIEKGYYLVIAYARLYKLARTLELLTSNIDTDEHYKLRGEFEHILQSFKNNQKNQSIIARLNEWISDENLTTEAYSHGLDEKIQNILDEEDAEFF